MKLNIIDIRSKLPRNGSIQRRPVSAITAIAVHWDDMWRDHEYDSFARYVQEANIHINRDWGGGARGDGIMYHYKIDNVGDVYWCRDHEDMLWNVGGSANWNTLAVCFDCYESQSITKEQAEAYLLLMEELCFNHPEFPASQGDVKGHREFNATACPGNQIMDQLVVPYRSSRGINLNGLVYDYPEQTPVVVTPAPKVEPKPVATSPENQHTSQVEIQPTSTVTETPVANPDHSQEAIPATPDKVVVPEIKIDSASPQTAKVSNLWDLLLKIWSMALKVVAKLTGKE